MFSFCKKKLPLNGIKIWLSGAVPEKEVWSHELVDRDILEFISVFSSLVYENGGTIIHGSHPSLTPVLVREAKRFSTSKRQLQLHILSNWYDDEFKKNEKHSRVTILPYRKLDEATLEKNKKIEELYSNLYKSHTTSDNSQNKSSIDFFRPNQVIYNSISRNPVLDKGPKIITQRDWNLSKLRLQMVSDAHCIVAIGGKTHAKSRFVPGVQDEINIANKKKIPTYILSGVDGYSKKYNDIENFNDLLSPDEQKTLAKTEDLFILPSEIVRLMIRDKIKIIDNKKNITRTNKG